MKNYNKELMTATYEGASMPRESTSNPGSVYWELYFTVRNENDQIYRFYVPIDSEMDNFNPWYHIIKTGKPGDHYTVCPFQKKDGYPYQKKGSFLIDADFAPKFVPSIFDRLFK